MTRDCMPTAESCPIEHISIKSTLRNVILTLNIWRVKYISYRHFPNPFQYGIPCSLKPLNLCIYAPINVFTDPGEGGHTRAFDSSSHPVGRDFDFIWHHGAPRVGRFDIHWLPVGQSVLGKCRSLDERFTASQYICLYAAFCDADGKLSRVRFTTF